MIEIKNIKKQYDITCPLKDITTTINKGDVISIIGPSGTGKSTLLRMINLLEKPTSGQIFFEGEEITAPHYKKENARIKMSMVFQNFNLFNHLSVLENLMEPQLDLLDRDEQEAYFRSMKALEKVGLTKQYLNYPSSLSGGQKQRVAIARAIVMDPEIYLFDEPTSALDPKMVNEVSDIIKDLADEGKTMMIVTHDMKLAENVSNRILYLDQGVIYEDDTPEVIFHNPKHSRTKAFIESLSVFKLSIHEYFDYSETGKELENYIFNIRITNKQANHLRSLIDELIYELLLKEFKSKHIRMLIFYDRKLDKFFVDIKYDGQLTNILFGTSPSKNIINSIAKNIIHKPCKEENFTNNIIFDIN